MLWCIAWEPKDAKNLSAVQSQPLRRFDDSLFSRDLVEGVLAIAQGNVPEAASQLQNLGGLKQVETG